MKIYHTLNEYEEAAGRGELPFRASAVTLGKFDGVHLGHQALLKRVKEASGSGLSAVVFAIDVRQEGILSHRERAAFLKQAGMDVLTECPFSKEFMNLTPLEFIERILIGILHAEYIAVGTDFRFGHKRMGDAQLLASLAGKYGYWTEIVPKERYDECQAILAQELVRASTSYAHYVTGGNMGEPKLIFLQAQTFQFHREMKMYEMGINENQLKPVRVLDKPDLIKFFTLLEER